MQIHAKYCLSGDNTLQTIESSISEIKKEDAGKIYIISDDYIVIVLSDANLSQCKYN